MLNLRGRGLMLNSEWKLDFYVFFGLFGVIRVILGHHEAFQGILGSKGPFLIIPCNFEQFSIIIFCKTAL